MCYYCYSKIDMHLLIDKVAICKGKAWAESCKDHSRVGQPFQNICNMRGGKCVWYGTAVKPTIIHGVTVDLSFFNPSKHGGAL